jgi:hypothetical protein
MYLDINYNVLVFFILLLLAQNLFFWKVADMFSDVCIQIYALFFET